ncbi:MAG: hypothetical protein Q4B90_03950 [Eubacteriales bacterium]|nr:hypothetical protein [Eubacteriales bacterium]
MDILEAYLSIDNVKCKGFTQQEVDMIQEYVNQNQLRIASPEFVYGCADVTGCTVSLIIGGECLVLVKMEEEEHDRSRA